MSGYVWTAQKCTASERRETVCATMSSLLYAKEGKECSVMMSGASSVFVLSVAGILIRVRKVGTAYPKSGVVLVYDASTVWTILYETT